MSIYKRIDFKGFTWRRASSLLVRQRKERDEGKGRSEQAKRNKERGIDRINVDQGNKNKERSWCDEGAKDSLLRQIYTISLWMIVPGESFEVKEK